MSYNEPLDPFLEKLKLKCPKVFREIKYIQTEPGWEKLIFALSCVIEGDLDRLERDEPELAEQIYVVQIKQKFGGLRYYMNHSTPFMDGAIRLAENMSFNTCEDCGAPCNGAKQIGGWITALCDTHYNEKLEKSKRPRT